MESDRPRERDRERERERERERDRDRETERQRERELARRTRIGKLSTRIYMPVAMTSANHEHVTNIVSCRL